jgi:hypothetical protein
MSEYKFGEPDKYGDFPYLYAGRYKDEQLNEILLERLPESYNMQLVDPLEVEVLAALVNMGIDSHLEATTMTNKAEVVDRKIGDKVVQRHLGVGFDKQGMICLIRRLMEFDANQHFDFSECDKTDDYESSEEAQVWDAARNLGSSILETLGIEANFNY